jgi:hypothetical protein
MGGIRRGLPKSRQEHDVRIFNARDAEYSESAFVVPEFDVKTGEEALRRAGIPFAESRTQVAGYSSSHTLVEFRTRVSDLHRAQVVLEEIYNG